MDLCRAETYSTDLDCEAYCCLAAGHSGEHDLRVVSAGWIQPGAETVWRVREGGGLIPR